MSDGAVSYIASITVLFLVKEILAIARLLPIHSFSHVFVRPSSALFLATDIFNKLYTFIKKKKIGKALNNSCAEFR